MSYHTSERGYRDGNDGAQYNCYHYTSKGLPHQPLHTLYTGRLLTAQDHYSGDNILHEKHSELLAHRDVHKSLYRAAKLQEEALNRHLGGNHPKVLPHPPVEPDSFSEDPALRGVHPFPAAHDNSVVGSSHKGTGSAVLEEGYHPNIENERDKSSSKGCPSGNCGDVREYSSPSRNNSKGGKHNYITIGCGCLALLLIIIFIVLYCLY